jgi:hypothetical protein
MNRKLTPFYLVIIITLSFASQSAKAISYTFDVDSSSGIGTGFFSIELPGAWPGNIGHATLIQASSFHGFRDPGDGWISLSVSLNEPIENPDNAVLFGASRAQSFFSAVRGGIGIDPVTAVDDIPGVTLRTIGVPDHGITALLLAFSFLVLLFLRRRLSSFV